MAWPSGWSMKPRRSRSLQAPTRAPAGATSSSGSSAKRVTPRRGSSGLRVARPSSKRFSSTASSTSRSGAKRWRMISPGGPAAVRAVEGKAPGRCCRADQADLADLGPVLRQALLQALVGGPDLRTVVEQRTARGVSSSLRGRRINSGPSLSSRRCTCWLTAAWVRSRRSAARVKLRCAASVSKVRSH